MRALPESGTIARLGTESTLRASSLAPNQLVVEASRLITQAKGIGNFLLSSTP